MLAGDSKKKILLIVLVELTNNEIFEQDQIHPFIFDIFC